MSRLYGIVLLRVEPGSGYGYNRWYRALYLFCFTRAAWFSLLSSMHAR